METSLLKRLLLHSSHYTLGSLLVTMASFISFPIFTRTFSVADYGALNLIASLLLFWTGVGKLGIQQSISRFHAECVEGRRAVSESKYVRTVLIGMGITGTAATFGWLLMALAVPASWWHDGQVAALLLPISGLVIVKVGDSAVVNLLRAQQRSAFLNAFLVIRKYLGLAVVIGLIFTVMPGLQGFYAATFLVEGAAVVYGCIVLLRRHPSPDGNFSRETCRDMIAFGAPMIASELAYIVLILGDRYVLQWMLGPEAVGHYSAAYNFCEYVKTVVLASFAQAVVPIYSRLYEQKGPDETSKFVSRSLRMYMMFSAATLAGMTAVGGEVLTTLASDKYAVSQAVIPFIIGAMCMDGGMPFFGAGMYLHKRNHLFVPFVIVAAIANIFLNILLVPRFGISGSAFSTLLCAIFLNIAMWRIGARFLSVKFPFLDTLKFCALAAIMYFAVMEVRIANHWLELGARITVGVAVYGALLLAFDHEARTVAKLGWGRLMRMRAGPAAVAAAPNPRSAP